MRCMHLQYYTWMQEGEAQPDVVMMLTRMDEAGFLRGGMLPYVARYVPYITALQPWGSIDLRSLWDLICFAHSARIPAVRSALLGLE